MIRKRKGEESTYEIMVAPTIIIITEVWNLRKK